MNKSFLNKRVIFILVFFILFGVSIGCLYFPNRGMVVAGRADLSQSDAALKYSVTLNGDWDFYWNKLLSPADFASPAVPKQDSLMHVPGSWGDLSRNAQIYPEQGVATYRMQLKYPTVLQDPAIIIKPIGSTYKIFANGQLVAAVDKQDQGIGAYTPQVISLPVKNDEMELIVQVASPKDFGNGLWINLVFGSKQVLEQHSLTLMLLQMLFVGIVFGIAIYYLILFFLLNFSMKALTFALLCLTTAVHSIGMGEQPASLIFPGLSVPAYLIILYFTFYNLIPLLALLIARLFPLDINPKVLAILLWPTLLFDFLLFATQHIRTAMNGFSYVLLLLQGIYILFILVKAVLHQREEARLMLTTVGLFIVSLVADSLSTHGHGLFSLSYLVLYGNLAIILAITYVHAKRQAQVSRKLALANERLIQADKIKDKILETEMSFLQAQIKPHFLYNALNVIAFISKKDGGRASQLIVDLAIYLRNSLEFNHLDKTISIEKELEFIDTYFNIEQARFGDQIRLEKSIKVPLDDRIPTLMIQPLIENAVRHGLCQTPDGGIVTLRIDRTDEGLCIEVEDDGVGFEASILGDLFSDEQNSQMFRNDQTSQQGIGFKNINSRLLRLYGQSLSITSETGRGCLVRFVIPPTSPEM
jgi:two-component system LytT family sensor kinase